MTGAAETFGVGASLLAMDVNDDACCLDARVVLAFFVGTPPGASSLLQGNAFIFGQVGCQATLLWLLIFLPPREAERRFCAVGNPAWMPG
jgi:hypothetical protein